MCGYVPPSSPLAIAVIVIGSISAVICFGFLAALIKWRKAPIMVAGQVLLVQIFTFGAAMLALWSILQLGFPSDMICMARYWGFHLAFTTMFGPLFLKVSQ